MRRLALVATFNSLSSILAFIQVDTVGLVGVEFEIVGQEFVRRLSQLNRGVVFK